MPLQNSMLIVENDAELRDMLTKRFIRLGFDVTPLHHPRQALEAASFKRFPVAIISHRLAELDGLELVRRLRLLVRGIQVILLISQCDDETLEDQALAAGAYECLQKPCRLLDLEKSVELALEDALVLADSAGYVDSPADSKLVAASPASGSVEKSQSPLEVY